MALYAVRLRRGGPWDWSLDMREQALWVEHASLMDALTEEGFIRLGGPLEGDREVLLIVDAESEAAIHARLAADPWFENGMLTVSSLERWRVLLGALG
jgi:uncharacterized protein YciI